MPYILHIETSTKICSVALSNNGSVLYQKENKDGGSHAQCLGVFVEEAISLLRNKGESLDAVAVSSGPGSYTGLRIGVSEAKGLCYGLGIPLIAIPSLRLMADAVIRSGVQAEYYCPMIDARRMEVYAAIYDAQGIEAREVSPDIVTNETYANFLSKGKVLFFGDGSAKCKEVIASDNAIFLEHVHPLASSMIALAENAYQNQAFVDAAYFEPFYLKEFMATVPKNKVI